MGSGIASLDSGVTVDDGVDESDVELVQGECLRVLEEYVSDLLSFGGIVRKVCVWDAVDVFQRSLCLDVLWHVGGRRRRDGGLHYGSLERRNRRIQVPGGKL